MWEANERWKSILHAGLRSREIQQGDAERFDRDQDAPTIFDRIIQRQIPSEIVMEDEVCSSCSLCSR